MSRQKLFIMRNLSMLLLLVASVGVKPACLWFWYQPKMPE